MDGVRPAPPRPDDPLGDAQKLWGHLGVAEVTDWLLLKGAEAPDYVLVTPEAEIHFGDDLLDYRKVRARLLVELRIALPPQRLVKDWGARAQLLRNSVREQQVEPGTAEDRVDEWLAAYKATFHHNGMMPEDQIAAALDQGPLTMDGATYLRPLRFQRFIENTFGERLSPSDVRRLLKQAGWKEDVLTVGDKEIRAWQRAV
jgi:hypothetical protein